MGIPLYLASRSPRRKDLLAQAGIRFQVYVPAEEELSAPRSRHRISAKAIVKQIAAAKAHAAARELRAVGIKKALVLSADTLVFLNKKVLGKPSNEKDARQMLKLLSGKWHEVHTGVTALRFEENKLKESSIQIKTKVRFFRLKPQWIDWYIATGEPFDKAGSYGCQGYGAALVQEFRGSYTNVVGLPLGETLTLLEKCGGIARQAFQE